MFTLVSRNEKTGPMPVTGSDKTTCPDACPLKNNGCYAAVGRLNIHWTRLDNKGLSLSELVSRIKSIPNGRIWRHNQMGDLPGENNSIDSKALNAIVEANIGKRGFTYTHKPMNKKNQTLVKKANDKGFTINLSADNLAEADSLAKLNVAPVVTILPSDQKENTMTPEGRKVVVCPNYTHNVQCFDCGLCQKKDRTCIVGFPAHGIAKAKVDNVFKN